jgi:hypothetical protein
MPFEMEATNSASKLATEATRSDNGVGRVEYRC